MRVDETDQLIESYHQAIWHELPNVVALYEDQLRQLRDDPTKAGRVEHAFDWPFDKGIPRYRSNRWLAIRLGTYPFGDLSDAIAKRAVRPSQLNHQQRHAMGFYLPRDVLDHLGL